MEKGTLIVVATQKGFAAKIAFVRKDGKPSELPISFIPFKDASLNGKACDFERDGGRLTKIVVEDKQLYPLANIPAVVRHPGSASSTAGNSGISDSLEIATTFLPKDVRNLASQIHQAGIDNFALKLNKAARFDDNMNKFQFFKRERKGENYEIKPSYGSLDIPAIAERQQNVAKQLLGPNNLFSFSLAIDWRLIQGLGHESVYETSISLHHVYGIPFLTASSIKGMIRGWVINEFFGKDDLKKAEDRALMDKTFCDWFGCGEKSFYKSARQGNITFIDAFPLTAPVIEVDVMNPHYGPYYADSSGKTPPADYHNPIPVHFLTVAKTAFLFNIGSKNPAFLNERLGEKTIVQWFKEALTTHGLGAKTAVGYGYFKETS